MLSSAKSPPTASPHAVNLSPVAPTAQYAALETTRGSSASYHAAEGNKRFHDLHVFMNLFITAVGAGLLSIPFTFAVLSKAQAIVMICVVGTCMTLTAHALLHAHVQVARHEEQTLFAGAGRFIASYRSMGIRVTGPWFGNFVSVVLAVSIYGASVGSIRIVRDMMPHMAKLGYDAFSNQAYDQAVAESTRETVEIILVWAAFLLIVFPLCTLKDISALKIPNYICFVCSLLLVVVVIYRSSTQPPVARDVRVDTAPAFARFTQCVSIYSYVFTMHMNLLSIFLQQRGDFVQPIAESTRRMTRSIVCVSLVCVTLYVSFGIFGLRLYGAAALQGNILVNLQTDDFMKLPLVAVFCTILLSFPLFFHCGRTILEELVAQKPATDLPRSSRVLTAGALLLAALLVATWVPGIETVFGLIGATTVVINCYVVPVVFFTKLYPWRETAVGKLWCVVLWCVVVFAVSMGARTVVFLLGGV